MRREEFLRILKESLEVSLEKDVINEQLDYYDKYISDEIDKGRTEEDVVSELGDPRLIAKTIKTVNNSSLVSSDNNNNSSDSFNNDNNESGFHNTNYRKAKSFTYDTNGISCLIAFLVIFIIIMLLFKFVGNIAYGLGSLFVSGPIGAFIVFMLVYFLFFRGKR